MNALQMNDRFRELVESLHPSFDRLLGMTPVRYSDLPRGLPKRAVYLFSEGDDHLYVGRTNNLRSRLRGHCAPTSRPFAAAFAFRLAAETTGLLRAAYGRPSSRAALGEDPVFESVFAAARVRVSQMDLRFVEEPLPLRQTLLQIYAATALGTQYNDPAAE
jgi:hypothetical protein